MATLKILTLWQAAQEASQNAGEEAPSLFGGNFLIPMLLIFGIFYFVLIRPERKKQRSRETMLKALKKGDKVVTTSGIFASVVAVQDEMVTLQVADGVRMRFTRSAVQGVLESDGSSAANSGSGSGKG
jgi:preprotein translocase subunit YajC